MNLFEIRDLTKVYGERAVLDIPKLDFEKDIIYALLGPNGSGKTTLLHILSLLNLPTTGRIKYNNRNINFTGNNLFALRREIVIVHQNPVLFTTTVYKNLEFGLKIRNIPKRERMTIIEESLELVGMGDFMGAEAFSLSGGETQRVAIARAIACSPKVIFFDEPTANVDVENQIAIERIITEISRQRTISVIFTTHNLTQASRLSRRVISLFEGRVAPTIYENIFNGKIEPDERGCKQCIIQDRIKLSIETEKTGNVRLSIDPFQIKILTGQDRTSKKNMFKGRLTQLTDEQDKVRATVDMGIPVNLIMLKDEMRDKSLYIGDEVDIFCPVDSIRVF